MSTQPPTILEGYTFPKVNFRIRVEWIDSKGRNCFSVEEVESIESDTARLIANRHSGQSAMATIASVERI